MVKDDEATMPRSTHGVNIHKIHEAEELAEDMERWHTAKVPD